MSCTLPPLRLPRTLLLTPLALVGCHDFVGDLGRIGFVSDLRVADSAWTPEHPIASGSTARFLPVSLFDAEGNERTDVEAEEAALRGSTTGRRLTSWTEEGELEGPDLLAVTAERGSGWVHFEGIEHDRFELSFVPAADVVFLRLFERPVEDERGGEVEIEVEVVVQEGPLVLAAGEAAILALDVVDRRGRSLGWVPDEVDLEATGGVSAWLDGGGLVVVGDADGAVAVSLLGEELGRVEVEVGS